MEDELVDTWNINCRIGLYLLNSIDEGAMSVKPDKGRSVRSQFCHMHAVRLMWLKSGAPNLLEGLDKLDSDTATKDQISGALEASAAAIGTMVAQSAGAGNRVKGFKPHTTAFVAYMIAHESHHRGMVELGLRQAGTPISDKVSYGIWEWGSR